MAVSSWVDSLAAKGASIVNHVKTFCRYLADQLPPPRTFRRVFSLSLPPALPVRVTSTIPRGPFCEAALASLSCPNPLLRLVPRPSRVQPLLIDQTARLDLALMQASVAILFLAFLIFLRVLLRRSSSGRRRKHLQFALSSKTGAPRALPRTSSNVPISDSHGRGGFQFGRSGQRRCDLAGGGKRTRQLQRHGRHVGFFFSFLRSQDRYGRRSIRRASGTGRRLPATFVERCRSCFSQASLNLPFPRYCVYDLARASSRPRRQRQFRPFQEARLRVRRTWTRYPAAVRGRGTWRISSTGSRGCPHHSEAHSSRAGQFEQSGAASRSLGGESP
ncbi:hypothetical protein C8R45DRAFT_968427 [Mycena sanguinolenta]|nr:hypothetical protein C8R45DRAFT_968427 [Mycena sanguinolenta]